jgi:hypothetical protein
MQDSDFGHPTLKEILTLYNCPNSKIKKVNTFIHQIYFLHTLKHSLNIQFFYVKRTSSFRFQLSKSTSKTLFKNSYYKNVNLICLLSNLYSYVFKTLKILFLLITKFVTIGSILSENSKAHEIIKKNRYNSEISPSKRKHSCFHPQEARRLMSTYSTSNMSINEFVVPKKRFPASTFFALF